MFCISVDQNNTTLIVGLVTNSLLLLVIITITAVYVKKKGKLDMYNVYSKLFLSQIFNFLY